MEVNSVLKINGEEVTETIEIDGMRFYESKGGSAVYIANKEGKVVAMVEADCGQNVGYIAEITDMTKK